MDGEVSKYIISATGRNQRTMNKQQMVVNLKNRSKMLMVKILGQLRPPIYRLENKKINKIFQTKKRRKKMDQFSKIHNNFKKI